VRDDAYAEVCWKPKDAIKERQTSLKEYLWMKNFRFTFFSCGCMFSSPTTIKGTSTTLATTQRYIIFVTISIGLLNMIRFD